MTLKKQRGISLFWSAVAVGVFTLACMAALMSMRHERNYFMEAWKGVGKSEAAQAIQKTGAAAGGAIQQQAGAKDGAMRKCLVDGKVTYSNVECEARGEVVKIRDTAGFEAPKLPPAPAPQGEGAPGLQDRMIEKAAK
ncbi:DUF4124 domain-containing protein [Noviherbaspirillum galbum]|uniref:DUF4124 domain-containing protein n=1 Tax=Noviherbaspirillum galbum TaxID=2709383 RepID=A0A6B3SV02_9BURK|nr:DUF4124 domain-containing protein [Noviherbaspirillum galbum]NEX64454.1 DUF4124 domain-containing protein [Noviherbaspirillum galbum]